MFNGGIRYWTVWATVMCVKIIVNKLTTDGSLCLNSAHEKMLTLIMFPIRITWSGATVFDDEQSVTECDVLVVFTEASQLNIYGAPMRWVISAISQTSQWQGVSTGSDTPAVTLRCLNIPYTLTYLTLCSNRNVRKMVLRQSDSSSPESSFRRSNPSPNMRQKRGERPLVNTEFNH